MFPTILGLIQATSLQKAGTSSQKMVMAGIGSSTMSYLIIQLWCIPHNTPGTGFTIRPTHAQKMEGIPAHSLLLSSYSKFAMAELGRNNLRPLIAVSLASTLSRALRAQQGTQLLISTALASLFSHLPCHQPQRIPQDVFLCCQFTAAPKEASKSGNKFRSSKRPWQSGQMYLVFSCCTSTTVSAEPFGSNKL